METTILQRAHCLVGLGVLVFLAWCFSANRRAVRLRVLWWGLTLQFVFAAIVLKTAPGKWVFEKMSDVVQAIISFADSGAAFVFGPMTKMSGFCFIVKVSSVIIFFSSLMAILYHLGIMQKIVGGMAKVMKASMGVSGAESLAAAANVFVGMTEAPLVIRPYVEGMTTSEIMALMTSGFATIAGSVLVTYVSFGVSAGHLLAASVMSAPASLVMAKLLLPETEEPETVGEAHVQFQRQTENVIDAAASGATVGVKLAINVGAMVLAFVSLVAMLNHLLGLLDGWLDPKFQAWFGFTLIPGSLQQLLGYLFSPLAFLIGVDWKECLSVGDLMGQKIALNEFIAFLALKDMIAEHALSPRSITLATYVLCGFSNFGSLAITIGGISTIAPSRRADLARLGLKAMAAAFMASMMTACVAGALL